MKNKLFLFVVIWEVMLAGCSVMESSVYLPKRDFVGKETNGSLLNLRTNNLEFIEGELLAVDQDSIYVLVCTTVLPCGKLTAVARKNVAGYTLRFADSKNYSWTIPVFTLLSISHGFIGVVTLPINWMVTGSLSSASKRSATFTSAKLDMDHLYIYARFPQGFPTLVDKNDLRLNLPQCNK